MEFLYRHATALLLRRSRVHHFFLLLLRIAAITESGTSAALSFARSLGSSAKRPG